MWIVILLVLSPMIYMPIAFVAFFVVLELLVRLGLFPRALPFVYFLVAGLAIGVFLSVVNAWRSRRTLASLIRGCRK